jgi:hypothetical protein
MPCIYLGILGGLATPKTAAVSLVSWLAGPLVVECLAEAIAFENLLHIEGFVFFIRASHHIFRSCQVGAIKNFFLHRN